MSYVDYSELGLAVQPFYTGSSFWKQRLRRHSTFGAGFVFEKILKMVALWLQNPDTTNAHFRYLRPQFTSGYEARALFLIISNKPAKTHPGPRI